MPQVKNQSLQPALSPQYEVFVAPNGTVTFIHDDDLMSILNPEKPEIERAAYVEPDNKGEWLVDAAPVWGPLIGPFPTRTQALRNEQIWLSLNLPKALNVVLNRR